MSHIFTLIYTFTPFWNKHMHQTLRCHTSPPPVPSDYRSSKKKRRSIFFALSRHSLNSLKNWPHWTLLLPWQPFFSFFLSLFLSFPPTYWFLFFCFTGFLPSPQCAVYNTLTDFHTFSFLLDCFHFHCCQIPHLSPYRFSLTSFCPFLLTSSL